MRLRTRVFRPSRGTGSRDPRPRHERGFTLVELLVALPLAALVAASAALLLVQQARHIRGGEARGQAVRELRHARLVLETDLAVLHADDLLIVSDSSLEFRAQLGIGIVCDIDPSGALVVVAGDSGGSWMGGTRAGDQFTVWSWPAGIGAIPAATTATVRSAPVSMPAGACGPVPDPVVHQRRWKLDIGGLPPSTRVSGAPFRLQRFTRYSHYRSGTQWWLGRRSRDLTGWDVVQPLAGPLQSAARRGMRVRTIDMGGADATAGDSVKALRIELRAPREGSASAGAGEDSLRFEITLRGASRASSP